MFVLVICLRFTPPNHAIYLYFINTPEEFCFVRLSQLTEREIERGRER